MILVQTPKFCLVDSNFSPLVKKPILDVLVNSFPHPIHILWCFELSFKRIGTSYWLINELNKIFDRTSPLTYTIQPLFNNSRKGPKSKTLCSNGCYSILPY